MYLPRLPVLLNTEAHRPGSLFPGPLGFYGCWLSGIGLISDFKWVKALGNRKVRLGLLLFGGAKSNIIYLRS